MCVLTEDHHCTKTIIYMNIICPCQLSSPLPSYQYGRTFWTLNLPCLALLLTLGLEEALAEVSLAPLEAAVLPGDSRGKRGQQEAEDQWGHLYILMGND